MSIYNERHGGITWVDPAEFRVNLRCDGRELNIRIHGGSSLPFVHTGLRLSPVYVEIDAGSPAEGGIGPGDHRKLANGQLVSRAGASST